MKLYEILIENIPSYDDIIILLANFIFEMWIHHLLLWLLLKTAVCQFLIGSKDYKMHIV